MNDVWNFLTVAVMFDMPGGYMQYLHCFLEAQCSDRQARVRTGLGDRMVPP